MKHSDVPEEDEVAGLIRLAGMRSDAPPDVALRAKGAVRAAWKSGLQRRERSGRIRVWVGLAAAATLILAVALSIRPNGPDAVGAAEARVLSLVGRAWVRPAGDAAAGVLLAAGDTVPSGAEVVTEGDGRVGLTGASGYSVRVDRLSRVVVRAGRGYDLLAGGVYLDSGSESPRQSGVTVQTIYGSARPIGTQFEVRLEDAALRVRVRRGAVELTGAQGPQEVEAGNEVRLDRQGNASRRALEAYDAGWAWVEQVMPGFDMDGRRLNGLLDWASRERGWKLRFADADAEEAASAITLTGTVAGLTVDEALSAVLPTCNMTHRVEQGVLIIARAN